MKYDVSLTLDSKISEKAGYSLSLKSFISFNYLLIEEGEISNEIRLCSRLLYLSSLFGAL